MNNFIEKSNAIITEINKEILPYIYAQAPQKYHSLIKEDGVIAGGILRDLLFFTKESINDIDIFFKKDITNIISDSVFMMSKNAANLFTPTNIDCFGERRKIQFITKYRGNTAESILDSFDINLCQIAFDIKSNKLIIKNDVMEIITLDYKQIPIRVNNPSGDDKFRNLKSLLRCIKILEKNNNYNLKLDNKEKLFYSLIKELQNQNPSDVISEINSYLKGGDY